MEGTLVESKGIGVNVFQQLHSKNSPQILSIFEMIGKVGRDLDFPFLCIAVNLMQRILRNLTNSCYPSSPIQVTVSHKVIVATESKINTWKLVHIPTVCI